jgi:hypothetical protein
MSKKWKEKSETQKKFLTRGSLRFFDGFVDDFHPTFHFKFVRDDSGHLIGALQLWRHQHTKEVKWVECECIDLPKIPG